MSRSSIVSVLLGNGFYVVSWAIACLLLMSLLLPMYKKTAVSDRTNIVIDTAAILF